MEMRSGSANPCWIFLRFFSNLVIFPVFVIFKTLTFL